ncbi:RDD family protein [Rhizobiales bacterium L72]|uniref:RDD family protein n=1 Tax=Propylenella binzhouense TaxID=2555902 RepID=A0A964T2G3_9HYPH|nr:RDD family protein [Propylenella binzhouense]MYZ46694.1 RDD family protein [Propylenella binzhouense]
MNTATHSVATAPGPARVAFDPVLDPALYDGVRTRRLLAFMIDAAFVLVLMVLATIMVAVLGILTLGLGWLLFPLIWPFVAIVYTMFTLGGPASATPGMRFAGLEMRTWLGERIDPLLALFHSILFWLSVTLATPLVLLVSLATPRKRLLHDFLAGTIVIRSDRFGRR